MSSELCDEAGQIPEPTSPDTTSHTSLPSLPAEVFQLIARHIRPRKDLASCCLVSKSFLAIFGRELWRSVRLSDVRHRLKVSPSPIRRHLLSYIEVLDLQGHQDADSASWCYGIAKMCDRLKVIIIPYRGRICDGRGPCRAIPTDRPLKFVFRNTESPLVHTPEDLATKNEMLEFDRQGTDIGRLRNVQRAVIEFGCDMNMKRRRFPQFNWRITPERSISQLPLRDLAIMFTPLTPYSVYREEALFEDIQDELWIDTTLPPTIDTPRTIPDDRDDLCSNLALTCVLAPEDCTVTIANTDQMPVWTGPQPDDKIVGIQFLDGSLYSVCGLFKQEDDGSGTQVIEALLHSDRVEAQSEMEGRMDSIKSMTKQWLEAFLKAEGKEDTLEARWSNIKFVTLQEYMTMRGREEEWFNHPWTDAWL